MRRRRERSKGANVQPFDARFLLDSIEAGASYGLNEKTIRDLAGAGVLPVVKLPGCRALRFRPETLSEIAKRYEVAALLSTEDDAGGAL